MSAFRFYTDAQGYVCGGDAACGALSDEAWKLTACPVRSLEECGVEIRWHGEPFEHQHVAQTLPEQQERVA